MRSTLKNQKNHGLSQVLAFDQLLDSFCIIKFDGEMAIGT